MKYLSVCSGIEAASVAWHPLGWQPVAFSEIEPFPSAVLAHHYPSVPNWGDMTKFQEWPDETVDLLVGGTPCQSFSVAGLRKGLEDPRGNLMLTYLAIARRYRPRWVVWENVPGVLSSGGGRDFGTFLGALGELGYGWAYRVLDAQWFGVAQRRRRVFVVGYLGDWQRAAKVLFEQESVRRDSPPSREARQGAAAGVGGGPDGGNAEGGALDAPYLTCSNIDSHVNNQTPLVAQPVKCATGDITHALTTRSAAEEDGTGRGTPLVPVSMRESGQGYWMEDVVAGTIDANMGMSGHANRPAVIAQPVGTDCYNGAITGDVAATIGTPGSSVNASGPTVMQPVAMRESGMKQTNYIAQPVNIYGGNKRADRPEGGFYVRTDEETSKCLDAASGLNPTCSQGGTAVMTAMQVRRLTPVECERLQGFPDGYTNIPWRKKPEAPDGPRYKALGNSMAVPCMAWIGKRIAEVNNDPLA